MGIHFWKADLPRIRVPLKNIPLRREVGAGRGPGPCDNDRVMAGFEAILSFHYVYA